MADDLSPSDRRVLCDILADPDPAVLLIVDPRPSIRTASGIQNAYDVSMLQAKTLAAAVEYDWPIRFADAASTTPSVRQAADELELDLATIAP